MVTAARVPNGSSESFPMEVSLNPFLRFVSASGRSKVSKVEDARGEYDSDRDFYAQFRPQAVAALRRNNFERLTNLPNVVNDGKNNKKANFRQCADALEKWARTNEFTWIGLPDTLMWTYQQLSVRVNPELIMDIGGEKYLVKLYLSKVGLTRLPWTPSGSW
jgi:hypothetical protein